MKNLTVDNIYCQNKEFAFRKGYFLIMHLQWAWRGGRVGTGLHHKPPTLTLCLGAKIKYCQCKWLITKYLIF